MELLFESRICFVVAELLAFGTNLSNIFVGKFPPVTLHFSKVNTFEHIFRSELVEVWAFCS